jgi:hypothetical protein
LANIFELLRHPLVGGDDLVKGIGDLAVDAGRVARQAHREIADSDRLQCMEKVQVESVAIGRWGGMPIPAYGRNDIAY